MFREKTVAFVLVVVFGPICVAALTDLICSSAAICDALFDLLPLTFDLGQDAHLITYTSK